MKKYLWAAIVVVILVAVVIAVNLYYRGGRHVAEIDGKLISIEEFQIYLYEQKVAFEARGGEDIWEFSFEGVSIENIAKQDALDAITYVKFAVAQADRMGIVLSDEEISQAEMNADEYISYVGDSLVIDRDTAINIMCEMLLVGMVYDAITSSYELSEADFIAYYDEYLKTSKDNYVEVEIQHIFISGVDESSQQRIGEARNKLHEGISFEAVIEEYSDDYDESIGVVTHTEIPADWDEALRAAAIELDSGGVSEIVVTKDGYYILFAKSVTMPDMEELKESLRNDYIQQKKREIYEQEYERWSRGILVRKNDKVWDEITIM